MFLFSVLFIFVVAFVLFFFSKLNKVLQPWMESGQFCDGAECRTELQNIVQLVRQHETANNSYLYFLCLLLSYEILCHTLKVKPIFIHTKHK